MQGFPYICFWRSIYGDSKSFPAPKGIREGSLNPWEMSSQPKSKHPSAMHGTKWQTMNSLDPQINFLYYIYLNRTCPCQHTPCADTVSVCWREMDVSELRVKKCERRGTWWVRTPCLFLHGERAVIAEFLWMKYGGHFLIHCYRSDVANVDVTLPQ